MDLENILRKYKEKKAYVETTEARIEGWKYAIQHPEMWYKDYLPQGRELGMPGRPHGSAPAPTENYIIGKEITVETIKIWISQDESRIFPIKIEIEQIEKALEGLTRQERCVIELKYFENMFWRDIELSFNNLYRQKNYITDIRLKQINKDALNKLYKILKPFYEKAV